MNRKSSCTWAQLNEPSGCNAMHCDFSTAERGCSDSAEGVLLQCGYVTVYLETGIQVGDPKLHCKCLLKNFHPILLQNVTKLLEEEVRLVMVATRNVPTVYSHHTQENNVCYAQ